MATTGVRWGWRVPCAVPGCPHVLERWGDGPRADAGPPILVNPNDEWAFHGIQNRKTGARDYIAYCPEHAGPAKAWSAAIQKWKDDRRQAGRTWWTDFVGRFSTATASRMVGENVRQWESKNPEPVPPWGTQRGA